MAKKDAEKNSHKLELQELKDLEEQIAKCKVLAPHAGPVKYAHKRDHRGNADVVIEEGATIREGQVVIRLPDNNNMQCKVKVSEALISAIRVGMIASVRLVGLEDAVLPGTVIHVNQYAEPSSWRSPSVKQYACLVRIDEPDERLKAGMSADVTVHVKHVPEALQVPVQALHAHGWLPSGEQRYYCFVESAQGWEARVTERGPTNDNFAIIQSGLAVGDKVSINPEGLLDQVSLPTVPAEQRQQAITVGVRVPPGQRPANSGVVESASQQPSEEKPSQGANRPDPSQFVDGILKRVDSNSDGVLSETEWPSMAGEFSKADANSDGQVDRSELVAAMRARMSRGRSSGAGG